MLSQNVSFSQCASMSQDCLIFQQQSPLPTQGTILYPTFKPPLHTILLFLLTLHPGGQTSEPTDFLTTFAHIIIRSSHLRDTMSPQAVVTQETLMLWCLPLDGEPSSNRFTKSSAAWRVRAFVSAKTWLRSEFLTLFLLCDLWQSTQLFELQLI